MGKDRLCAVERRINMKRSDDPLEKRDWPPVKGPTPPPPPPPAPPPKK